MQVNKQDFYYGAFYSVLIQRGIKPTLFDESKQGCIARFETDKSKYTVFIKYVQESTKPNAGRTEQLWHFNFSSEELQKISDNVQPDAENCFVGVCATKDLMGSQIAVIKWEEAIQLLGSDSVNRQRRISVSNTKRKHGLLCYGTAKNREDGIWIKRDPNATID